MHLFDVIYMMSLNFIYNKEQNSFHLIKIDCCNVPAVVDAVTRLRVLVVFGFRWWFYHKKIDLIIRMPLWRMSQDLLSL